MFEGGEKDLGNLHELLILLLSKWWAFFSFPL